VFEELKNPLKGQCFLSDDVNQEAVMDIVRQLARYFYMDAIKRLMNQ
jgi:hypothetical protein